ncbi:MAG: glycine cleavage system aminomethyltransferase GcvT [SAR324 cluster bacterium]|nr:glycine cleavage system aminomethyltransferase GcvT [SAR324 cluster bacterium]
MSDQSSQVTPLFQKHIDSGATMVNFGGWKMPVRYSGDKKEHFAVREHIGIFDVSHMGEIWVKGKNALPLLQYLTCNDVNTLYPGRIQYNVLMSRQGGAIDDILIYCRNDKEYLVVVNASNQEKDFSWMKENNRFNADISYESENYAQIAVQGPKSIELMSALAGTDLSGLKYYHFIEMEFQGFPVIISRTGYTASDGFEIYMAPGNAPVLWDILIEKGQPYQLIPCGLGARDSLRVEGKMILYGNDLNEETTVLEAGLGWIVKLEKGEFIGRDVLLMQKEKGLTKKWVGFEMLDNGIPRHGYPVIQDGIKISEVTSGVFSPTFNKPLGMAYLPIELTKTGSVIEIEIRKKLFKAQVVATPFYKIQR